MAIKCLLKRIICCRSFAAVALSASFVFNTAVEAQDYQLPKKFFDPNYVNQPAGKPTPLPMRTVVPKAKTPSYPRGVPTAATAKPINEATLKPEVPDDRPGSKVKSINLIISADPDHFEKYYLQLLALRDKYKLPVQEVFIVGDPKALFEQKNPSKIPGRAQGGTFRYVKKVPVQFGDVKSSPTFAIETEQGTVLMEGFSDIERGFNSKGEFVEPQ